MIHKKMSVMKVCGVTDTLLYSEDFGKLCNMERMANAFMVQVFANRKKEEESWELFWLNIYNARFPVDEVVKSEILYGLNQICEGVFEKYPFGARVYKDCFFAYEILMNVI